MTKTLTHFYYDTSISIYLNYFLLFVFHQNTFISSKVTVVNPQKTE